MSTASEVTAELLTMSQVAQLLNCGPRSVWRWSHSGRMPSPVRINSAVRFRRDEILSWIDQGCQRCDGRQEGSHNAK